MSDEKAEAREQRARRLRRNLEEAVRINDEHVAEWPQLPERREGDMMRTDKLPNACPKCGADTRLQHATYVPAMKPYLALTCRCGWRMTCSPNDTPEEPR